MLELLWYIIHERCTHFLVFIASTKLHSIPFLKLAYRCHFAECQFLFTQHVCDFELICNSNYLGTVRLVQSCCNGYILANILGLLQNIHTEQERFYQRYSIKVYIFDNYLYLTSRFSHNITCECILLPAWSLKLDARRLVEPLTNASL